MKEFGAKLVLKDKMSEALKNNVKQQKEFSKQVQQTRQAVKDLGKSSSTPTVAKVQVQDEATQKANLIVNKLRELRSKITSPIITLKDNATDKTNRIKAKLKALATNFTPIVKIRDLATQGLSKIKNTLGGFAKKVTSPIVKLKDEATPIISKVGENLGNIGRKTASPIIKAVNKAAPVLTKVGSGLKAIGKTVATATVTVIDKASKVLSKVGGALKQVSKVGIAALAGAGVASVKVAADFESGMSRVAAISGTTGGALEQLSAKAKEMGAKTKFSAKEATEAYQYMAMAGWKSEDMLAGIEPLMKLAGASGEDLATTSDIVTDGLTAFGLSAKDTGRFADVLAAASSNANTNVAMMGESFKYAAPVAGALGFSIEDTSLALGLMANSGIKASSAGTALRSMLTNMAKPTKQSSQALDALNVSLTDSSGQMKPFKDVMVDLRKSFAGLTEDEKASYAASIAGKTGMSGLLAVVNSSDKDFDKLASAIDGSNGACGKMYDTANDNLAGQLTILKSTVESIGIAFGEKLTPAIKKAVGVVQGIGDKITKMLDPTTAAGKKFDELGSKIVGTVKHIIESAGKLLEPFKQFGDGVLPLTDIISIMCDGITARIDAMMPILMPIAEGIAGVIQSIIQAVTPVINSIIPVITAMIPTVSQVLSVCFNIIQTALPVVGNLISTVITAVTPILSTIFSLIQTALPVITQIIQVIASVIQSVVPVIGAIIQSVVPPIQQVLEALSPVIQMIGKVVQMVAPVIGSLVRAAGNIIMAILPAVGAVFQNVANVISSMISVIMSVLQGLYNFLSPIFGAIQSILGVLADVFGTVFGTIADVVSKAVGVISSVISSVMDVIQGFVDKIGSALSAVGDFISKGANAVGGALGFAYGKDRVPYDKYPAILHQGEKVLTRNQADQYDRVMSSRGVQSRAMGTGRVARDNTLINAHQGEKLLTKQEADQQSSKGGLGNITIAKLADEIIVREDADIDKIVDKLVKRLEKVATNVE